MYMGRERDYCVSNDPPSNRWMVSHLKVRDIHNFSARTRNNRHWTLPACFDLDAEMKVKTLHHFAWTHELTCQGYHMSQRERERGKHTVQRPSPVQTAEQVLLYTHTHARTHSLSQHSCPAADDCCFGRAGPTQLSVLSKIAWIATPPHWHWWWWPYIVNWEGSLKFNLNKSVKKVKVTCSNDKISCF